MTMDPFAKRKRPRPPRPVASFGPEIFAALMRGATHPIHVKMPYKIAVRFRMRIHQLREAMRASGHEKYPLVSRVGVTIEWPIGTHTTKSGRHVVPDDRSVVCDVTLRPNDAEFAPTLALAGIDPLSGIEDRIKITTDDAGDTDSSNRIEDLLRDLLK
jgi:hypothetical protein